MARMLYSKDSTPFSIRTTKRHIHLCKQTDGCESFATRILPVCQNLQDKRKLTEEEDENCSFARDLILLRKNETDDAVRATFKLAEIYDKNHAGQNTVTAIFPDRVFSPIIDLTNDKKPFEVEALALRIDHLGTTHSLNPQAAILREKATAFKTALTAEKTAQEAFESAKTEEELARTALRKAYEENYLDGRKLLGSSNVHKIFPVINHGADDDEKDDTTGGTTK